MSESIRVQEVGLSSPWVTYYNKLKYSVGVDPDVKIGALIPVNDSLYIVILTVVEDKKAKALATLLSPEKNFGGVTVMVFVQDAEGQQIMPIDEPLTPFSIADLFLDALTGNELFADIVVQPFLPGEPNAVYPVFQSKVIQFFDDNLADLYQNFNGVAATVFGDVMLGVINRVTIIYSTAVNE